MSVANVTKTDPTAVKTNSEADSRQKRRSYDESTFFIIPLYIILALIPLIPAENKKDPFSSVSENFQLCLSPTLITMNLILFIFRRSIPELICFILRAILHIGFYIRFLFYLVIHFHHNTLNSMPESHFNHYRLIIMYFHGTNFFITLGYFWFYCELVGKLTECPKHGIHVYDASPVLQYIHHLIWTSIFYASVLFNIMVFWYYWQPDWHIYEFFLWKKPEEMDPIFGNFSILYTIWLLGFKPFVSRTNRYKKWFYDESYFTPAETWQSPIIYH